MANKLSVELSLNAKGYQSEIDKSKEATNDFNKSVDDASKSTAQYTNTIGKQTKDLTSLRKQLAQSKKEAQNLAMAYNQLSDAEKNSGVGRQMKKQLDEAIQSAGNFQDVLGDVQRQIKNVASDTATWDTLSEGITVAGSALSTLGGAYASITGDQESFNKAIALYTTTQSAATTITKVANLLQKESNLMMKVAELQEWAKTKAIIASTSATKGATIAQRAFNIVANANPYMLLASALALVVGAFAAFAFGAKDAKDAQEDLNAAVERGKQKLGEYDKDLEFHNRMLRAEGASSLEVVEDNLESVEREINKAKQRIGSKEVAIKVNNEQIKSGAVYGKAYNKTLEENEKLDKEIAADQQYILQLEEKKKKLQQDQQVELKTQETQNKKLAQQQDEQRKKDAAVAAERKKNQEEEERRRREQMTELQKLQEDQSNINKELQRAIVLNDSINIKKHAAALNEVENKIEAINTKMKEAAWLAKGIKAPDPISRDENRTLTETVVPKIDDTKINKKAKTITQEVNYEFVAENLDGVFNGIYAIDGLQDSMKGLVSSIQEGASAWDIFVGSIQLVQEAMQTYQTVLQAITMVQDLLNMNTQKSIVLDQVQTEQEVANSERKIATNVTEAGTEGVKSASKAGWPQILWAIPAVLALVAGAITMAKGFATGGIVPGSSFHGDNMIARVNSGEMILNAKQQRNMFNALDSGALNRGGGHIDVGGSITIKGSDLHVALRNYDKKISKIS